MSNGNASLHFLTGTLPNFVRQKAYYMDNSLLSLTHEQQQAAVEEIQQLMSQGISAGEAIQIIANKLRQQHAQSENQK